MPRITFVCAMTLLWGCPVISSGFAQQPGRSTQMRTEADPQTVYRGPQSVNRAPETDRPTTTTGRGDPIAIPPPSEDRESRGTSRLTGNSNVAAVVTSSLAIVLGLFFLVVWVSRRMHPKASASLPTEALEVMGRSPLANRHHLQLIRLGKRLLLVSVTPDRAETLAEVCDPEEVDHLAALCRKNQPGSITASFRQVLHQLGTQSETDTSTRRSRDPAATADRRRA